jgi:hypothetical protein
MISFENTENAFKAKTSSELTRSYWLFKLISNRFLVKLGARFAPLMLKIGFKKIIKNTIFKQFVGGENIHDCSQTIEQLGKYNIGTILDYSVHTKNISEKDAKDLLVNGAFQQTAEAEGKWNRVKLTQVQLCSYYNGFSEIYQLREDLKAIEGDKFNLKSFHEKFLSFGSAPVKYIRTLMIKK